MRVRCGGLFPAAKRTAPQQHRRQRLSAPSIPIPNGFGIVFVIVRKCRLGLGVDWVIEALARDPLHAMALCPRGPVSAELMMMSLVPAITLAMFRTMSVAFKLFAVTGMLALGVFAFAPGSHAQKAKAQSQPALQAPRVLPKPKPADLRIAQPKRQIEPQRATAPARASPEPLLFLSAEYLQNEKQVEDKLKRVMTICKGC